jgi:hypothetical protein
MKPRHPVLFLVLFSLALATPEVIESLKEAVKKPETYKADPMDMIARVTRDIQQGPEVNNIYLFFFIKIIIYVFSLLVYDVFAV